MHDDAVRGSSSVLCPFCKTGPGRLWGRRGGHPTYECPRCGVVFFDRAEIITSDYQDYYRYSHDWDRSRINWELAIRATGYRKQLAHMASFVRGNRLLDVGAGPGYLCRVAAEANWQATGIEPSDQARSLGTRFLNVHYRRLEEVELASVDVIVAQHVLEHIAEPGSFLRVVRQTLRSPGLLVVHVPHVEPLSLAIRNRLRGRRPGTDNELLCSLYMPEHISGFTARSLRAVLGSSGFRIVHMSSRSMWSAYHDPFFLRNFLERRDWSGIGKRLITSALDNLGNPIDRGGWIVAYAQPVKACPSGS